jgi:hypothetical protein
MAPSIGFLHTAWVADQSLDQLHVLIALCCTPVEPSGRTVQVTTGTAIVLEVDSTFMVARSVMRQWLITA